MSAATDASGIAPKLSNSERGERVRRALLAVARLCHERRCVLPRYYVLGAAIGTDGRNITRHMGLLVADGALVLGTFRRRPYVKSVRS